MSEVVSKAVAFLRANPDRHIVGSLFLSKTGETLDDVTSPKTDERICGMCIIGALAYELDYDYKSALASTDHALEDVWGDICEKAGIPPEYAKNSGFIWKMNDQDTPSGKVSSLCHQRLANPAVLDFVTEISA